MGMWQGFVFPNTRTKQALRLHVDDRRLSLLQALEVVFMIFFPIRWYFRNLLLWTDPHPIQSNSAVGIRLFKTTGNTNREKWAVFSIETFAKFPISSTRLLRNVCKLFRYWTQPWLIKPVFTSFVHLLTWPDMIVRKPYIIMSGRPTPGRETTPLSCPIWPGESKGGETVCSPRRCLPLIGELLELW